jgi:uncharacterized protein (TIGR03435 family)
MKLVGLVLAAFGACAQGQVFEVASVKPSQSLREGSSIHNQPGRFETSNTTLAKLIQYALPAQDFQVVGGPGWMNDARFDIVAKTGQLDSDVKNQTERLARIRSRLRHLLEDRFQLQLREEHREVQVFGLQVEKSGVRMKAAEALGNVNMDGGAAGASLSGKGMTMPRLAEILSGIAGRPVNDETGLTDAYDVELKYTLEMAPSDAGTPVKESSLAYPSLFTALKEQLGLRLSAKRGTAPVWVVVRAEKPTEN